MPANPKTLTLIAPVTIAKIDAAASEADKKSPRKFDVLAYTGGPVWLNGWDKQVIVDLSKLQEANSLIANLDHNRTQRVGHVTGTVNDGKQLSMAGVASAATAARNEVVESAADGFKWQASIEADVLKTKTVDAGTKVTVNGQTHEGPLYVVEGRLTGFGFVSHGADDNTLVSIAAAAASRKGKNMDPKFQAWIEAMLPSFDIGAASPEQIAGLKANYDGQNRKPPTPTPTKIDANDLEAVLQASNARRERARSITQITAAALNDYPKLHNEIEATARLAIEGDWALEKFELEMMRSTRPQAHTVQGSNRDDRMTGRVLEAALCQTGKLNTQVMEKLYSDQELQAAYDHFKDGIGLKQLLFIAAEANGLNCKYAKEITLEIQQAAFGNLPRHIQAGNYSTVVIPNIISNVANKFVMEGWNWGDRTCLRIAHIKPVNDFKQTTTVSLTGAAQFEKVNGAGELKHGSLGEVVYNNKADTYGIILSITRQDYVNDDAGALTSTPRRVGRGGILKLNDLFWGKFLNNGSFFTSGNANVNTGVADMTAAGLAATETIFMDQTDPDGKPLGAMPAILVVPTPLKGPANTLMTSERMITGSTTTQGDGNIWKDRFRVESSPYMGNSAYTGYSAAAYYMIADPNDLAVIEIAALFGRVEPTVETAVPKFSVQGIDMCGYSDVGVELQEYRGGVRADGGSS